MPSSQRPPRQHRAWRSVVNVVVAQLSMVLLTASSFIVTPAMLTGLGDEAYGGWLLLISFISYMRLLDLGTSGGTVKYTAGALARGDSDDVARVANATTAIFLTIGLIALGGTVVLMQVLPRLYPNVAADQGTTILLLGLSFVIDLTARTFTTSLRARSLHFVYDSIEFCSIAIFKVTLIIYFAKRGELSYRILGVLTLAETIIRVGLTSGAALVLAPHVRKVNPFRVERATVKKLVTTGVALSIISVADVVRFQLDAAVIGFFLPESPLSISIFGVGTRLTGIAYATIGTIGGILMPRFSGLSETGDKRGLNRLLRDSSLATGLVASFALVYLAVLGPHFLELWLQKPWVSVSGQILRLLLPGYFLAVLTGPASGLLIGRGRLRGLTIVTVIEAVFNLVLSIFLVHPLGVLGIAWGTLIPMVIVRGAVFPYLVKMELGIPIVEYFRMNLRAGMIGVVYLLLVGGLAFVPAKSFFSFFVLSAISAAVYGVLLLVTVREAREALPKLLARLRRRHDTATP